MQGKNHIALALAVPLAGAMLFNPHSLPQDAATWGGLILGSLAPDLDGEGSICYLGNFLPRHITPKPVVRILNWLGRTISSGIRAVFGHRKALHWPLWGCVLLVLGITSGQAWLAWFGIGYVLHIAGDSLTKSGVPLFGPVLAADINFTPMVTGKWVEKTFGYLLWCFVAWRLWVEAFPGMSAWTLEQIDGFMRQL
jgi:membrane-bound metal-dependent hydrolase YbcI (DUF457 family)